MGIYQLVYGSTPYSSGYSILGRCREMDEQLCQNLVRRCESYDQQLYAAPFTPYSISIFQMEDCHGIMEIFGGWQDQMGRPSRITRMVTIDNVLWSLIAGNPFLLLWLLPPVKKCIAKKRNEIQEIPPLNIEQLTQEDWNKLWWKETSQWLKIVRRLPSKEGKKLTYFQEEAHPFVPREIKVEKDQFSLCRAIVYCLPIKKRASIECESFSLNEKAPGGLCFRYGPYCRENPPSLSSGKEISTQNFTWKIATIIHSVPEPYIFYVLARLYSHETLLLMFALLVVLGMVGLPLFALLLDLIDMGYLR